MVGTAGGSELDLRWTLVRVDTSRPVPAALARRREAALHRAWDLRRSLDHRVRRADHLRLVGLVGLARQEGIEPVTRIRVLTLVSGALVTLLIVGFLVILHLESRGVHLLGSPPVVGTADGSDLGM
jgi:hypothetical protein